jgi:uncharacterized protein YutE (UPF0331/DUF86 family)
MNDIKKEELLGYKIDMSKIEYRLGISYEETLDVMNRTINALYDVIESLQKRVLDLEIKQDE